MKNPLLLLVAIFALTISLGHADSASFGNLSAGMTVPSFRLAKSSDAVSTPTLSGRGSDFAVGLHQVTSPASFAELSTVKPFSLPPTWVLALGVALAVLTCRIFGLQHARDMADHERDLHHAKARMYQALQNPQV